ncbi:sensor histidine kinase [Microbacterium capsulatum]|uniref:histidine kinase n=1 Tax=Microbacterium capsulatum TaxID=3041921 RepID=A0ABU0XJB4_9MICO|nr:sensor histidine kinase [Microbacterium sp. ASV81]MDQ4215203.1 sensor histidine kinase [Microbacterium sp. ASV81]
MRRRIRRLSTLILLAQVGILSASLLIGFVLFAWTARANLTSDYQARAADIAQAFADVPDVQRCLATPTADCDPDLQRLATATSKRTGAAYVVVIDMDRVRHSHPDPALIGQKVSEDVVARDGRVHLGTDIGSTGTTANARVPVFGIDGGTSASDVIGEVSVGIRESSVAAELLGQLPLYAAWLVLAFGIGAIVSFGLASLLKRRTFGLELDEIARLLQEREATLHGIREGVIAIDPHGRITVVNDEAQRLLHLPEGARGRRLDDVLAASPIRDALTGTSEVKDAIAVTDTGVLVLNRMPVTLAGRPHGAVLTLQDRTEVTALTQELDGERSFAESIRAQQHEFSNRMHAVAGLLELGRPEEALQYLNEIRGTSADLDRTLRTHVAAPMIVGLLLGKAAEATERGIDLVISPETDLGPATDRLQALVTILGNLIDNAFDALADSPAPRRVVVEVVETPRSLTVRVSDNGPGVPDGSVQRIFESGYTTKRGSLTRHSGLGLSLVHTTALRLGGTVTVENHDGAAFTVVVPRGTGHQPVAAPAEGGAE